MSFKKIKGIKIATNRQTDSSDFCHLCLCTYCEFGPREGYGDWDMCIYDNPTCFDCKESSGRFVGYCDSFKNAYYEKWERPPAKWKKPNTIY